MGIQHTVSKLLINRNFLHVVFVVSLLNLIAYLVSRNFQAIIFFILIGSIVGNFSKNMTVVLLVPLFLANLFVYIQHRRREGFETEGQGQEDEDKEKEKDQDKDKEKDKEKKSKDAAGTDAKKAVMTKVATKQGLPTTPVDEKDGNKDSPENGKEKMEESFQSAGSRKGQYDIDYAATIEDAYAELNKIIGGDGIQKLTADTQQLMNQQLQLTKAMQGFAPMIEQIKPLMESVGPLMKQAKVLMGPNQ